MHLMFDPLPLSSETSSLPSLGVFDWGKRGKEKVEKRREIRETKVFVFAGLLLGSV